MLLNIKETELFKENFLLKYFLDNQNYVWFTKEGIWILSDIWLCLITKNITTKKNNRNVYNNKNTNKIVFTKSKRLLWDESYLTKLLNLTLFWWKLNKNERLSDDFKKNLIFLEEKFWQEIILYKNLKRNNNYVKDLKNVNTIILEYYYGKGKEKDLDNNFQLTQDVFEKVISKAWDFNDKNFTTLLWKKHIISKKNDSFNIFYLIKN